MNRSSKQRRRFLAEQRRLALEAARAKLPHSDRVLRNLTAEVLKTHGMAPYSQRREFYEPEILAEIREQQEYLENVLTISRSLTICKRLEVAEYPSHRREIYHIASVTDDAHTGYLPEDVRGAKLVG